MMGRWERVAWVSLAVSCGYLVRYVEDVWHLWREVRRP